MSKQDWAREKVEKHLAEDGYYHGMNVHDAANMLRAERSRARRIVRAVMKERHINSYDACVEIMARLQ